MGQLERVHLEARTAFARHPGAVAAATAGLHFTPELLQRFPDRAEVTLRVSYGTFAPVEHEDLSRHEMHWERYHLDAATAERINRWQRPVLAVGTSSSAPWRPALMRMGGLSRGRDRRACSSIHPTDGAGSTLC